jgi:hypothetical protein
MSELEIQLVERRRINDHAVRDAHNDKARRSNMLLCTATDPENPFEMRLEAFRSALEVWRGDNFGTLNVERQCPALLAILRTKGQA